MNQQQLGSALHSLFPRAHIITNARKKSQNLNPNTNRWLELDYHIPEFNLSFEYQDPHHYTTSYKAKALLPSIKQKDTIKKHILHKKGETLISIPFWWDGNKESLIATIREARHDLLTEYSSSLFQPIPTSPHSDFDLGKGVPGIGELMSPVFATQSLLHPNITWWMSEKYDGLRTCWNPIRKKFYSKSGRELDLSASIEDLAPKEFLDAELWFGRGNFYESQVIAQSFYSLLPKSFISFLRIVAFDCATIGLRFETSYTRILKSIPIQHPFITVSNNKNTVSTQLQLFLDFILKDGGEGVVVRLPNSLYQHGPSAEFLKLKARRDREALVTGIDSKDCTLKLPSGSHFVVPINKTLPLSVGDIVTFSYASYKKDTNGWVPIDPIVSHVRKDVIWKELVSNTTVELRGNEVNALTHKALKDIAPKNPKGYWTVDDNKNARELFYKFARDMNSDPHDPNFWYSLKRSDLFIDRNMATVIKSYGGSSARAVLDIFPNIGLDQKKLFAHKRAKILKASRKPSLPLKKDRLTALVSPIMRLWWKVQKQSVE